jgi:hypothetical protein
MRIHHLLHYVALRLNEVSRASFHCSWIFGSCRISSSSRTDLSSFKVSADTDLLNRVLTALKPTYLHFPLLKARAPALSLNLSNGAAYRTLAGQNLFPTSMPALISVHVNLDCHSIRHFQPSCDCSASSSQACGRIAIHRLSSQACLISRQDVAALPESPMCSIVSGTWFSFA